ncbi:hypothetical protein LX32DRAFT_339428 [Colletotrichum zoysiae]|uniref:Uncharacterized protein n=1 Tax=Colletotrichum zoysiae TaxID=1216348 RepID=A0AAD9HTI8_9PEZI|nr:hypothetical protein LX32DRAFT_339428 [Colletotrichum zoysiae]
MSQSFDSCLPVPNIETSHRGLAVLVACLGALVPCSIEIGAVPNGATLRNIPISRQRRPRRHLCLGMLCGLETPGSPPGWFFVLCM